MSYTPLTDPFNISFTYNGEKFESIVTYVKAVNSCANFFNVAVVRPGGIAPFYLKEKPAFSQEHREMVWVDEQGNRKLLYQLIGNEVDKHLKNKLGVFLIDTPTPDNDEDSGRSWGE